MNLNTFFEGIRMMPKAVSEAAELQIPEEGYQKMKMLFQTDKDGFYRAVLKEKNFRLRFLYYFSRMACDTYECYRERNVDEKIYWDTFYDLTICCENCFQQFGEYGINEYKWFFRHIECSIWRLGRLEFEEMSVCWREIDENTEIQEYIPVLNVHIPQGEKLELSAVKASFGQAFQRWGSQIPIICDSWLLYPGLAEILPAESNIIKFQKLFRIMRVDFDGGEAQRRIFGRLSEDPADYPEATSLQKKAKEYLQEGKQLGSGLGILQVEA